MTTRARRWTGALLAMTVCSGCVSRAHAVDAETAAAEEKAVRRAIEAEPILSLKAVTKARVFHAELRNSIRVCLMETLDATVVGERRATFSATYQCGPSGWRPGRGQPLVTSTVTGDLEKIQGNTWIINSFF